MFGPPLTDEEKEIRRLAQAAERAKVQRLSPAGSATTINVITEDDDDVIVWLDTDIGTRDGLVIGVGETRDLAIQDAVVELRDRLRDLEAAVETQAAAVGS